MTQEFEKVEDDVQMSAGWYVQSLQSKTYGSFLSCEDDGRVIEVRVMFFVTPFPTRQAAVNAALARFPGGATVFQIATPSIVVFVASQLDS